MPYNFYKRSRKSLRLKNYDYSQRNYFFLTIVLQNRASLFGEIQDGKMQLSPAGEMVEREWLAIPSRFPNTSLHAYVIMPDHFHAILEIVDSTRNRNDSRVSAGFSARPTRGLAGEESLRPGLPLVGSPDDPAGEESPPNITLGDIVGAFKSITTVKYINGVRNLNWEPFEKRLWQRNYHERIIRNFGSYKNISYYIHKNPLKWED